jgi:hypothetical protein
VNVEDVSVAADTAIVPLGEGAIVALIDVQEVRIVKGAGVIHVVHGGPRIGIWFLPGDLEDR